MDLKEYKTQLSNQINDLNKAIEQVKKIYDRAPSSTSGKNAEYAIHLLKTVKKEIQSTLNKLNQEIVGTDMIVK